MKLFNLVLFVLTLTIAATTSVLAADSVQETLIYESSFDNYKSFTNDKLSDWKSINVPSNGGGHAGHSMAGMQNQMSHEQMENMSPQSSEMSRMDAMSVSSKMSEVDPSDMKGMDHSQMKHERDAATMADMDHSKMTDMGQESLSPTSETTPNNQPTQKAAVQEMSHENMDGHIHGDSKMKEMSQMQMDDSNHDEIQPNHDEFIQAESLKHESESTHDAMEIPSMETTKVKTSSWEVVPNFHPIVVHFPIALTIVAFLLSIAAYVRRGKIISVQLAIAGHFTLWFAALGALMAVLFGWLAFNSVNHDDAGHAAMLLHRAWAIPSAIGLILLASWDIWKKRANELMSIPVLIILFILSGAILVTGWLGGEVVYRHGIGVLSIPAIEGEGHDHDHGVQDNLPHANTKDGSGEETGHHAGQKGEHHEHK